MNNKITEYTVVTHENISTFLEKVNERISMGWQPIGGVCFDSLSTHYIQSLVRYAA